MRSTKKIKIAFVHDDFIQFGGAEKFFLELILEFKLNPDFEIKVFSSLINKPWKQIFIQNKIIFEESFLNKLPFSYFFHKVFFIFDWFYLAFANFNFDDFDFVISSSTRFGHSILTKPHTYHISYINSPARALWDEKGYFFGKKFFYFLIKNFLPQKRIYDFYSQNYADLIISNSKNIQAKIKKYYNRKSLVLYPFVNLPTQRDEIKEDYFVLVSRLVSWKRIDYVIQAFNQSGLNLKVIGTGSRIKYYKKISKANISFLGYLSEGDKNEILSKAKALIFPQIEDFGLTIIEAINFSCPIIYYNRGGAKEILNKNLGVPYSEQTKKSLLEALEEFNQFIFKKEYSKSHLIKFSKYPFLKTIQNLIYSHFVKKRI